MDKDSNKPSNSGASGNGVILLVTLLAGALLVRQVPLNDSRPSTAEPKTASYVAADVDARLWQDPFGAVARGIKEQEQLKKDHPELAKPEHGSAYVADDVSEHLQAGNPAQPIFIGVLVPGGIYPADTEWRRRARYAVLSALKEFGYAPEDPEHLNYFRPDAALRDALYAPNDANHNAYQFFPFEWFDKVSLSGPSSGSVAFRAKLAPGKHRLMVIWLDQGRFSECTADRLDRLFAYLSKHPGKATKRNRCPEKVAATDLVVPRPRVIILGPGDSTILKQMAADAAKIGDPAPVPANDIQFYDYAATVRDADLLPAAKNGNAAVELPTFFAEKKLSVFRTIGDDRQVACALRDELSLRAISPPIAVPAKTGNPAPPAALEVVLVAEWDTDYGRTLAGITKSVLTRAVPCATGEGKADTIDSALQLPPDGKWLESFTYLRGLDGRVPARPSDGGESIAGSGAGNEDKGSSTSSGSDEKRIERAEGQAQLDYLRRLAIRLRAMDQAARSAHGKGIRAIGILGSDIYDKLLVLQALRPSFPNTLFFTTELDARMLHPMQLEWTRNLLVASNFGLELAPPLQSGNPPFRDSYQTSLYFAALLALNNAIQSDCETGPAKGPEGCAVAQSTIDGWRAQTRIFEIGRHGPFDLSRGKNRQYLNTAAAYAAAKPDANCGFTTDLRKCGSVHPPAHLLAPKASPQSWRLAFLVVTLAAIALALALGASKYIGDWALGKDAPHGTHISAGKKAQLALLGIGGLALLFFLVWRFPQ